MQAPVRRVQAAFGRFASLSGLSRLNNGIVSVGRSAVGAFQSLGQIVPVLGTLTGAASVAGVYRLASAWAQVGTDLRTTSRTMGMAPQRLQTMQNAAKLAGGSAEAMTGALQQLSQERWAAVHNQDPAAAARFRALQISPEDVQTKPIDQLFQIVASRIRGLRNPTAQAIAATERFGSTAQGLMPVFQQTNKEWKQSLDQAERYSHMSRSSVDAANSLRRSQAALGEAVEDFGNSIAEAAAPGVRELTDFITNLIAANRKWIAQDIGDYVRQFVTWLRAGGWNRIRGDIEGVYHAITNVVDSLGGWKSAGQDALLAVEALFAARVVAGVVGLSRNLWEIVTALRAIGAARMAAMGLPGMAVAGAAYAMSGEDSSLHNWLDQNPLASKVDNAASYVGIGRSYAEQSRDAQVINQRTAMAFFRDHGRSQLQAAAIVGNFNRESNLNPNAISPDGEHVGIGQWDANRQADFERIYHRSMRGSSLMQQLDFAARELDMNPRFARVDAGLRSARTLAEGVTIFDRGYEAPGNYDKEDPIRIGMAEEIAKKFGGIPSAPPMTVPPGNGAPPTHETQGYVANIAKRTQQQQEMLRATSRIPNRNPDNDVSQRPVSPVLVKVPPAVEPVNPRDDGTVPDRWPSAPEMTVPSPTPRGTLEQTLQRIQLEIDHRNAPPGTRARVTKAPPGTRVVNNIPVQRAMPPELTPVGN
ncbi:phage tail protein [Gluconacetobacter entanii]|nr:phage tail protein [Gluconacetobacter entanii]